MKSFFFITTATNARYGQNITNKVYQIKKNVPVFVGIAKYNTGSYRGDDHEAMQVIIDLGLLPKNCMSRPKSGYINRAKQDVIFQLRGL